MTEQSERLVSCCGLYCGNCGIYKGRIIASIAEDLKELIVAHGFPHWVPHLKKADFSFEDFQKGLDFFSRDDADSYCQVPCREGGGIPCCKVRPCAVAKAVRVCFECDEFPCELFSDILQRRPHIVEEAKEFKRSGMKRWLEPKEEASRRGFVRGTGKYYTIRSKAE